MLLWGQNTLALLAAVPFMGVCHPTLARPGDSQSSRASPAEKATGDGHGSRTVYPDKIDVWGYTLPDPYGMTETFYSAWDGMVTLARTVDLGEKRYGKQWEAAFGKYFIPEHKPAVEDVFRRMTLEGTQDGGQEFASVSVVEGRKCGEHGPFARLRSRCTFWTLLTCQKEKALDICDGFWEYPTLNDVAASEPGQHPSKGTWTMSAELLRAMLHLTTQLEEDAVSRKSASDLVLLKETNPNQSLLTADSYVWFATELYLSIHGHDG